MHKQVLSPEVFFTKTCNSWETILDESFFLLILKMVCSWKYFKKFCFSAEAASVMCVYDGTEMPPEYVLATFEETAGIIFLDTFMKLFIQKRAV